LGERLRLLIVEDTPDDAYFLIRELQRVGYELSELRVETADAMRRALAEAEWDMVISDYSLPGFDAPRALQILHESGADIPLIIVSGTVDDGVAVDALRAGARDFITKGRLARLGPAVERELREARARHRAAESQTQLEERLRQAERMEAVGQLSGGIAHDFNNLLAVISSYADMLRADMPRDDQRRADLDEIVKAAGSAATLTRQLLAFSRRQVLQPVALDINEVVHNTSNILRRTIGETIELSLKLEPTVASARADRGQVEQVLMNLVVNARDAMPRGGTITIATADEIVDADHLPSDAAGGPGPYVALSVSDHGSGIPPHILGRIFEPFFTTKEKGRGTGLGLATVYGIVQQSRGVLRVQSEQGVGTTFEVLLPRAETTAQVRPSDRPQRPATNVGSATILLVEDDAAVRKAAARVLGRAGYKVLQAEGPSAAEKLVDAHDGEIALLVTDVVMPGCSGPELAARLVAKRRTMNVLVMSGYAGDALGPDITVSAEVPFLQKPFTADSLLAKVREVLGGAG
jgi:signal transduction histidine kinase